MGAKGLKGPKRLSAVFVIESVLFVQTNVTVNTNVTSKLSFVFLKHIDVSPLTQVSYLVNSILNI